MGEPLNIGNVTGKNTFAHGKSKKAVYRLYHPSFVEKIGIFSCQEKESIP